MVAIRQDTPTSVLRPSPRRGHGAERPQLRVLEGGRSPVRLAATYRRRRLAVLVAAGVVVVLAAIGGVHLAGAARSLVTAPAPAVAASGAPGAPAVVIAQPGDTLWTIAQRLPHHGDVRAVVDELAALNGGPQIRSGQRVLLPAG